MRYGGRLLIAGTFILGACASTPMSETAPINPDLTQTFVDSTEAYSKRLEGKTKSLEREVSHSARTQLQKLNRMKDLIMNKRNQPLSSQVRGEVEELMRSVVEGDYSDISSLPREKIRVSGLLSSYVRTLEGAYLNSN